MPVWPRVCMPLARDGLLYLLKRAVDRPQPNEMSAINSDGAAVPSCIEALTCTAVAVRDWRVRAFALTLKVGLCPS